MDGLTSEVRGLEVKSEQVLTHEGRISWLEGIVEQILPQLDRIKCDLRWTIGLQSPPCWPW